MKFNFINNPGNIAPIVLRTLGSLMNYDLDLIPIEVEISFVEDPTDLFDGEVAAAGGGGMEGFIRFRDDAPFFSSPITDKRVRAERLLFFQEVVIHELAHVLVANLLDEQREVLASMFGRTAADFDSPEDTPWEDRLSEGVAETFKVAFLPRHMRLYPNRTNVVLPIRKNAEFRHFWRNMVLGQSDLAWVGWTGFTYGAAGTTPETVRLRRAHRSLKTGEAPPHQEFPLSVAGQLLGAEEIESFTGPVFSGQSNPLPGYPNLSRGSYIMIPGALDSPDRDFFHWRGQEANTSRERILSALDEDGKIRVYHRENVWPKTLLLGRFTNASQAANYGALHVGTEHYRWRLVYDHGASQWATIDPEEVIPLGTVVSANCESYVYPVWETEDLNYISGPPLDISFNFPVRAIETLPADYPNAINVGRIRWEYIGEDPPPTDVVNDTLVGWSTEVNHSNHRRTILTTGTWEVPPENVTRLAGVLVSERFRTTQSSPSATPGAPYPKQSLTKGVWVNIGTTYPVSDWFTNGTRQIADHSFVRTDVHFAFWVDRGQTPVEVEMPVPRGRILGGGHRSGARKVLYPVGR
jgi:hypothetical protein